MKLFLLKLFQSIPFIGVLLYQDSISRQFTLHLTTQKYLPCLLRAISFLYFVQGLSYFAEGNEKGEVRYMIVALIQCGIAPCLFHLIEKTLQSPKESNYDI